MRQKNTLLLLELLLMLLVFALVAGMLLQVFVRADELSRESEARSQAAVVAQTAAEQWKTGETPAAEADGYTVSLTETDSERLTTALVSVSRDGEELFSLTVASSGR